MNDHESLQRLAGHAGLRLQRDEGARQWVLWRGTKAVHRTHELRDVAPFLKAWASYVR